MVKRARKSVSYNDLEECITIKYLDIRAIPDNWKEPKLI